MNHQDCFWAAFICCFFLRSFFKTIQHWKDGGVRSWDKVFKPSLKVANYSCQLNQMQNLLFQIWSCQGGTYMELFRNASLPSMRKYAACFQGKASLDVTVFNLTNDVSNWRIGHGTWFLVQMRESAVPFAHLLFEMCWQKIVLQKMTLLPLGHVQTHGLHFERRIPCPTIITHGISIMNVYMWLIMIEISMVAAAPPQWPIYSIV